MSSLIFLPNLFFYSVYILVFGTIFSYIVFSLSLSLKFLNKNNFLISFVKIFLLVTIGLSFLCFIFFIYNFYSYYTFNLNYQIFSSFNITPKMFISSYFYFFEFSIDFFAIVILFLAYFVGVMSLLSLDNRLFFKNIKYFFSINLFIIFVFFFVFSANILLFFLFYEFLLIPSFLFVYFISPSRRSIQASLYFLIWTQIGSVFVLFVIAYMVVTVGSCEFFDIKMYSFSYNESFYLFTFLFLGFGFKVPIWPFHYWLTKTHVEAPSGFSMFLSGFLVKTAIYGFYKITSLVDNNINNTIFVTICCIGVFDASLKMWGQTDIKKLVAYCTIQEMNLIYLTFCWGDANMLVSGMLFIVMHGSLSTLMFFLVDCIQRRFNSRSVVELSGILQITPMLGISIIIMCIMYSGLPGMLKFTCEFYLFSSLFNILPVLTVFLFFTANVIGLISFSKCWFNITFGMFLKNNKKAPFDLNKKELYIVYINVIFLFISSLSPNLFFI